MFFDETTGRDVDLQERAIKVIYLINLLWSKTLFVCIQ
jgi:hypothetical protein